MQRVAYVSAMMTTPFFALFGWTWFYLSSICGIFTITNYIFSLTLRMIGLLRERGFGWWLLGGLWAPTYKGDEEHHGFQQGASRESSPNESYGWAGVWCKQQPDPVSARRNYRIQARRDKKAQLWRDLHGK
jgi:hypothetical protein